MADYTLTGITLENPSKAGTYSVPFVSGHAVGKLVEPDGTVIAAATDEHGGIIVEVTDQNTVILYDGVIRGIAGAAAAANARIYSDGDGTASDAAVAAAGDGTTVCKIGHCISATRARIFVEHYERDTDA